jgi:hypothetical protein|nr:SIMPL domain-containing protein [Candidatus Acidoferrales bacterium]
MKRAAFCFCLLLVSAFACRAQNSDIKFIADTLVIQADGTFEADPDLATLTFDISSQDKELKPAYDKASQALQKVVALAEKNGLSKADIFSGVLLVTPYYEGDRKKRAKSFSVTGQIVLKVRDFTKLGPIMDESVTDEITDFRSLTYSLSDEEAAKQHAVAEAMRRAAGRANAALEQKGQKVGVLRFANVDVTQIRGVTEIGASSAIQMSYVSKRGGNSTPPPPPVSMPRPEKITLTATIQCAFQIL